jgi:hypothetical protein
MSFFICGVLFTFLTACIPFFTTCQIEQPDNYKPRINNPEGMARISVSGATNRMGDGKYKVNILVSGRVDGSPSQMNSHISAVEMHDVKLGDKSQDISTATVKNVQHRSLIVSDFEGVTFGKLYYATLVDYHVLLAPLMKRSLLDPLWLRVINLFLYLTIQFGLAALVFTDNYIDNRMMDNDKDEFSYPIRKEFARIALNVVYGLISFNVIKYTFKSVPEENAKYMREAINHGDGQAIAEAR